MCLKNALDFIARYSGFVWLCGLAGRRNLIILLYHSVGSSNEKNIASDQLFISPEYFERQMKHIRKNCTPVSLADSLALLSGAAAWPRRPVVVTFDDGFMNNYSNAFPVLKQYEIPATIFINTAQVGEKGKEGAYRGLEKLGWKEIDEMAASGLVSFGAHTANHVRLSNVDDTTAKNEIIESVNTLQRRFKEKKIPFAFPFGLKKDFLQRDIDIVKKSGCVCNCVAYYKRNYPGANLFLIGRVLVRAGTPFYAFKNICSGVPFTASLGYIVRKIFGR